MFGINEGEFFVLLVVALIVIGPQRMPRYAAQLARLLRNARSWLSEAKDKVSTEVGDDIDWDSLDPRRYDPRRIVKDALFAEPPEPEPHRRTPVRVTDGPAPFDDEST